ncbi:MAG: outer membrane beta-barrel family protein [Ferruginibacter sp.]
MKLVYSIFTLFFLLIHIDQAAAQVNGSNRAMGGQNMNLGHFYGKIMEGTSSKAIEGASIQLIQNKIDTATRKKRDFVLAIVLSDKKGEFSIENLPIMGAFRLRISAVGFKLYDEKQSFSLDMSAAKNGDYSSMLNGVDKDLGNIKLTTDAQQLQNVTVTASKPLLQLYLDKKVYNVEKDITSTGGTALDVMKNVPSVNVDIDGNVSLRNAPPQIFVDGRPTTLSLDQIPADQIASVEIMTNPSAKYDASGGGAGILNIVLKKNRKAGYNGNVRASIDSRGRPGFGGDINVKQNKMNLFAAGMFAMRKSISTVSSKRTDYLGTDTAHFNQENAPVGKGFFAFGRLGLDYFIDNRNTITLSGNIVRGRFKNKDLIDIYRDTVMPSGAVIETGLRNLMAVTDFKNYGTSLSFKHNFAKAGKELTADLNYNYSNNFNTSDYSSQYFDVNKVPISSAVERSSGGGTTNSLTVQSDFINPISQTKKIEMGLRMGLRNYDSNNDNFIQDMAGNYVYIPALNVKYKYDDAIYAVYTTYSQQIKEFSFQLGLRLESSKYDGDLTTRSLHFSNQYPISLFPSVFLTQKLGKRSDLQLNYSRKINRPNFFQLIPFIDFSDSLNLSVGNPNLVPEFTNLVEFAFQTQYGKSNSILMNLYGRNTDNLITRYQYRDNNPNPAKSDSVLFTSYANANRSYTFGLELTGKNKFTKWWDLTTNVNLFNSTIKASNLPGTSDNSQFSWFLKLNNSFKLPKNFSIQLTGDYQAKTLVPINSGRGGGGGGQMFGGGSQPTAQGYIKPIYGADIAIKKEFLKNNAASLTLQFSDIFRTKKYETHTESSFFMQDNSRRRDPQVVRLNFNWRFGKFDVALFKRKNMKGEMENMQNMQQNAPN